MITKKLYKLSQYFSKLANSDEYEQMELPGIINKCPNCGSSSGNLVEGQFGKKACTKCFSRCNDCDSWVSLQRIQTDPEDKSDICENCFWDKYSSCEDCGKAIYIDDAIYLDDRTICQECSYRDYSICAECGEYDYNPNKQKEKDEEITNDFFCSSCSSDMPECHACGSAIAQDSSNSLCNKCNNKANNLLDIPYNKRTITFTKEDRILDPLMKLVPISVKDLKSKYPRLAAGLSNLIKFNNGKDITKDVIDRYRDTLEPDNFTISPSIWKGMQRSTKSKEPQLTLIIPASDTMLNNLKQDHVVYELFDLTNNASRQSGHPYKKDMLGWVRLELNKPESYLLVDEVQSDHGTAIHQYKTESFENDEFEDAKSNILIKFKLSKEQFQEKLAKYNSIVSAFEDIAMKVISEFSKKNGYSKIYYHTYNGGMDLKGNNPPERIYKKLPKSHGFEPSEGKPFGLDADFLEREANYIMHLLKVASLYNYKR